MVFPTGHVNMYTCTCVHVHECVLYCTVLYSTVLYSTLLYSVLYCTLLYSTLLYCSLLYCILLYFIVHSTALGINCHKNYCFIILIYPFVFRWQKFFSYDRRIKLLLKWLILEQPQHWLSIITLCQYRSGVFGNEYNYILYIIISFITGTRLYIFNSRNTKN